MAKIQINNTVRDMTAEEEVELATTQASIQAKQNHYTNKRLKEYPDAVECVHALLDGGDTLADLQAKRTAIKNKYPKE